MNDVDAGVVTDKHTHIYIYTVHTDRQTDTQDKYSNPPAHARRGLISYSTIPQ